METIHASCVAIGGRAVLLRGASGSGKSDLALRLIDDGAELVADDYVEVEAVADGVIARAPARIAGLMEVRGLGLVRMPFRKDAAVGLMVDLVAAEAVERLPEPQTAALAGKPVRRVALAAFEASAAAKVRLALQSVGEGEVDLDAHERTL